MQKLLQAADLKKTLDVMMYVFIQGRTQKQVQFRAEG